MFDMLALEYGRGTYMENFQGGGPQVFILQTLMSLGSLSGPSRSKDSVWEGHCVKREHSNGENGVILFSMPELEQHVNKNIYPSEAMRPMHQVD